MSSFEKISALTLVSLGLVLYVAICVILIKVLTAFVEFTLPKFRKEATERQKPKSAFYWPSFLTSSTWSFLSAVSTFYPTLWSTVSLPSGSSTFPFSFCLL
ncbi:hypothetical protein L596_026752 [Steinernema carpocapsae]|uniref:Uncharacterized protein n=1 Tax=Steinernema carpocapsae TaxID=34508 RepID=A0A4U5M384_STECR|nr:hypothetical protein L596_026752 [Steinernema carpocapsae]